MSDHKSDGDSALSRVRLAVTGLKAAIEGAESEGYRVLAIVHSTPSDVEGVHVQLSANRGIAGRGGGYPVDLHTAVKTITPGE